MATRAPAGTRSSKIRERSAADSEAITFADTVSPPKNSTLISSMVATTWAAVMTLPSAEIRTPEPVSRKRTWPPAVTSLPFALITTTDGVTLRKTSPGVWAPAAAGTDKSAIAARNTPRALRMSLTSGGRELREIV